MASADRYIEYSKSLLSIPVIHLVSDDIPAIAMLHIVHPYYIIAQGSTKNTHIIDLAFTGKNSQITRAFVSSLACVQNAMFTHHRFEVREFMPGYFALEMYDVYPLSGKKSRDLVYMSDVVVCLISAYNISFVINNMLSKHFNNEQLVTTLKPLSENVDKTIKELIHLEANKKIIIIMDAHIDRLGVIKTSLLSVSNTILILRNSVSS